jgi:hypothetical protein
MPRQNFIQAIGGNAVIKDISVCIVISTGSRRIRRMRVINFLKVSIPKIKRYRKTHTLSFFEVII